MLGSGVRAGVRFRQAVRVLLVDEADRVLLFSLPAPRDGVVFWLATGGGIADGEDAMVAARREIYAATGLRDLELKAEIWHRLGEANGRRDRSGLTADQCIDGRDTWMRRSGWGGHTNRGDPHVCHEQAVWCSGDSLVSR